MKKSKDRKETKKDSLKKKPSTTPQNKKNNPPKLTVPKKTISIQKEAVCHESVLALQTELIAATDKCDELAQECAIEKAEHANALDELSQDKMLAERALEKKIDEYRLALSKEEEKRLKAESVVRNSEHMITMLNAELESTREQYVFLQGSLADARNTLSVLESQVSTLAEATPRIAQLEKEVSDLSWFLGEEKDAHQKVRGALQDADSYIQRLTRDSECLNSELEITRKQRDEFQWYLGEARTKIAELEGGLSRANEYSHGLEAKISDLQDSLAQANLLAAKWMGRWDALVQETIRQSGELNPDEIDSGKFLENRINAVQEESTQRLREMEETLSQMRKERDSMMDVNSYLQDELAKEKAKSSELQSKYDEANWYLGEARHKLETHQLV